jgi:hypothetical protein
MSQPPLYHEQQLSFPVLGIPPHAWPGERKLTVRQAIRQRTADNRLGTSVVVTLAHAYVLPHQPRPSVVIGNSPLPASPSALPSVPRSALSLILRRRPDAPACDALHNRAEQTVTVEGVPVVTEFFAWGDPRVMHAAFAWRDGRRIEIAGWDYPLDAALFRSLAEIDTPLEDSEPHRPET